MKTHNLTVTARPQGTVRPALRHITFWAILLVAVGTSRLWFGGAFVVDFVAVVLACFALFAGWTRAVGFTASMTREEARAWAAAGAPEDVKAWKAGAR